MSPESAVVRLAEIVGPREAFTEGEIYDAMAADGIPDAEADLAFKFTQIAWGRVLLGGLGIQFSPDYYLCNGQGDIVESGRLAEQPHFAAAMRVVPHYARTRGFTRLALTSADVNAINNALNNGSKPEDLVTGPAMLFIESPTREGMEKVQQHLRRLPQIPRHPRGT